MTEGFDEARLSRVAERTVDKLVRAARLHNMWIITLAVVCAILVAVAVTEAVQLQQSRNLQASIQQGSIAACQSGNKVRAADKTVWDSFINLLLESDKASVTSSAFKTFEADVAALPPSPEQGVFQQWITLQTVNNASSAYNKVAGQFESYIASVETSQNCAKLYK